MHRRPDWFCCFVAVAGSEDCSIICVQRFTVKSYFSFTGVVDSDGESEAVAGLVLGLRFAHSLGVLHGHLTGNNILFDSDVKIQIADFCVQRLAEQERNNGAKPDVRGFSVEDWTLKADVLAFAEIFSEIVSRDSTSQSEVPMFASEIIEGGQSAHSGITKSFCDIFETLSSEGFQIVDGVDCEEISDFVREIESLE
jgi:serine/threonine protein kinase